MSRCPAEPGGQGLNRDREPQPGPRIASRALPARAPRAQRGTPFIYSTNTSLRRHRAQEWVEAVPWGSPLQPVSAERLFDQIMRLFDQIRRRPVYLSGSAVLPVFVARKEAAAVRSSL